MIKKVLARLGLDKKEIKVYLQLLKNGASRASTIAGQLKLPRTTVQNILLRLEEVGLTTKHSQKNVHIFTPVHPDDLAKIIEVRKRKTIKEFDDLIKDINDSKKEILSVLGSAKRIPRVRFYKGEEAARKLFFDTLSSKTEVKGILNYDSLYHSLKDVNDEYVAEREKTNVKKRSMILDTPLARKEQRTGVYSPKSYKGSKWIDPQKYHFTAEVNIYDGKVSYLTYADKEYVGVLIEDRQIYEMQEALWRMIWDSLPENDGEITVKKSEKN